jgi:hypothetical protein
LRFRGKQLGLPSETLFAQDVNEAAVGSLGPVAWSALNGVVRHPRSRLALRIRVASSHHLMAGQSDCVFVLLRLQCQQAVAQLMCTRAYPKCSSGTPQLPPCRSICSAITAK